MKRARDVIGLPIISVKTGKQIGTAKDMELGEDWSIEAVLLETKHWFSTPGCILWKDIIALGEDAITVHDEDAVTQREEGAGHTSLINGDRKLKGLPVVTANGQQLGIVDDVYLDPNLGKKVIGYELTEGFISDLREGRKWLPLPESVTVGEDAIIVPMHCQDALEDSFIPKEE
ncbi:PRC-barrel domain-containing protein [Paenibacillus rigui]|uniref:Photosystem reaction center subunit H n=1 Tax=Paenibacillus rigui TaxID=554312 RepID=A0A229UTS7_9BACL|nr:PRC-barrel domain-containing protein [Paenibacillus rigui]OXM86802.1 photosystem reaction center subunit H [Paenibacillus rigui]